MAGLKTLKENYNFSKLILLAFVVIVLVKACSPGSDEWTDEALIHDGQIIPVTRTVQMTRNTALSDGHWYIDSPSLFGLEAINPNTKEEIEWQSKDQGVRPVLLDFDGAITYLVILLPQNATTNKKYGCPWPPYVFLRHEQNGNWARISASEAPSILLKANLSFRYDKQNMNRALELRYLSWEEQKRIEKLQLIREETFGFQTAETIARNHTYDENGFPEYYFQINIPRNRDEWLLKYPTPNCRQLI